MTPAEGPGRKKCPICGKPAVAETLPFCSKRCADVDLNRWLSGAYVVPAAPDDDDDKPDDAAPEDERER